MNDKTDMSDDRRQGGDRRSGRDRRSGEDRRSGTDRRSGKDRRAGWGPIKDHQFQGILTTTATVSHLLGQPLTVITGYVDLLSASTKEEETKEKLQYDLYYIKNMGLLLDLIIFLKTIRIVLFGHGR